MEWVETTGRTIEEAKSAALDRLGVVEDDAEFEIIEEPRVGLFGRQRGEARVRARVRPTTPRAKVERRDRKKRSDGKPANAGNDAPDAVAERAPKSTQPRQRVESGQRSQPKQRQASRAAASSSDASTNDAAPTRTKETDVTPQQVADEATNFISGLVGAFGLTGTTAAVVEGDDIEVKVDGADLGLLVGPRGSTLQAVQEIVRVVAQRRLGDHDTHLRVDVGGYRERRREALSRFAQQVAEQVVADGTARSLEPMSSADRKVVHDVLAEVDGVDTSSAGEEPNRRVVISPANA
ncbi:MAG: RNA-binding cell elongation regulator Jag/EloR [Actinomycetota bacterium]|jgi:spoIIIJ-associated protein